MSVRIAVILAAALVVGACTPHRMDVRQGNYLTQEIVDQLEVGMTREQVQFLLGTPLTASPFTADRWDYVYFLESRFFPDDRAYVVLWFADDVVDRIEVRERPGR
jgi:outer membrane protein assembly factor BamE